MDQDKKKKPQILKPGDTLIVASHNQGKVREINDLLAPFGMKVQSAGELGLREPVEDGDSFAANAIIKAKAAAIASGLPALADDSGLEVNALDGAPGIYSARWAGEAKDFSKAMEKVEQALAKAGAETEDERRANFTCALCLAIPDAQSGEIDCQVFEGRVFGHLVWPPRGDKGFGYDPVFVAETQALTFGEMEPQEKHAMSHRARAFEAFVDACFGREAR